MCQAAQWGIICRFVTSDASTTLLLIVVPIVIALFQIILPPLFQLWLEHHASQSKPAPEIAPEPSVLPTQGWFMRLLNSPWVFPPSFIVLNVWWLIHSSHSCAPITRLDMYNVATMAAAIFFDVLWISIC